MPKRLFSDEERKDRKRKRNKLYRDNLSFDKKIEIKNRKKAYDKINKEKINKQKIEWYRNMNPKQREKALKYRREYNLKNKDKIKEWNKICQKKYYEKNKKIICAKIRKKLKENQLFKLSCYCRNRIRKFINSKHIKKSEIIGCDWIFLKKYIEKQFKEGMGWNNYGKWHIDHIVPLSIAKTDIEIKKLCHYSNLQPLWAEDNIRKSNKII